jgi:hypothetical protein
MNRLKNIILIVLIISSQFGYGQLFLGARAGYSISSVTFMPTQDEKTLYDQINDVGLAIKYFDLKYIGFQGEINYTQRGYRSPIDEEFSKKRINTYLEMPIFMQIRTQHKGFFLHINAGFYFSILIESEQGTNHSGSYNMETYEFSILRDNRLDYGIPGGAGLGYDSKWGTFQLDIRYFYGLGDLYLHSYQGNPLRSPARVQNVSISYLYNLSRIKFRNEKIEDIIQDESLTP